MKNKKPINPTKYGIELINRLFRSSITKQIIPQFANCEIRDGKLRMMPDVGTLITFPVPCAVDCIFEFNYLFDMYRILGRFPSIEIVESQSTYGKGKMQMIQMDTIQIPGYNETVDDTLVREFKELNKEFNIETVLTKHDIDEIISCRSFVSRDEMRQAMKGINVANKRVAATDAHRLRWRDVRTEMNCILPEKYASVLKPGKVFHDANHFILNYDECDFTIQFPLITAKYPDYNSVIPTDNHIRVIMDRNRLIQCVRKAIIVANKATHQIVLSFSSIGNVCTITSSDLDFNIHFADQIQNVEIKIDIQRNPYQFSTIAFNAKFMLDILMRGKSPDVVLDMQRENKPIIVDESNLLMPIMTNY